MAVPNLVMVNGKPTQSSLNALCRFLSVNLGDGSNVVGTYDSTIDANKVIAFAKGRMNDTKRAPYNLLTNNCKNFAHDAIQAGGK